MSELLDQRLLRAWQLTSTMPCMKYMRHMVSRLGDLQMTHTKVVIKKARAALD
jgi:hypothetical protein